MKLSDVEEDARTDAEKELELVIRALGMSRRQRRDAGVKVYGVRASRALLEHREAVLREAIARAS